MFPNFQFFNRTFFQYPKSERIDKCAISLKDAEPSELHYTSTNPLGPLTECHLLPESFITCEEPVSLYGQGQTGQQPANESFRNEGKCLKMGGYRAEDVELTNVKCRVLPCIECSGSRIFTRSKPCIM